MSWISAILFIFIFECFFNGIAAALSQQCGGCPALQPGAQYPSGTVQFNAENIPGGICTQTITCNNLQKDIIGRVMTTMDDLFKMGETNATINLYCINGTWHYNDGLSVRNYIVLTADKYYCTGFVIYPGIIYPDKTPPTPIQQCGGCSNLTTGYLYPPETLQSKAETFPNGTCKQTLAFNNLHYDLYKRLYGANLYATIYLNVILEHPKYGNISTELGGRGQRSANVTVECVNGKWYGVFLKQRYEITPEYYKCDVDLRENTANATVNNSTTTPENFCTYCDYRWGTGYTANGNNCMRNQESVDFKNRNNKQLENYLRNGTTDYCVQITKDGFCCCPKISLLSSTSVPTMLPTSTKPALTTSIPSTTITTTTVAKTTTIANIIPSKSVSGCNKPGFQQLSAAAHSSLSYSGKFGGYFQHQSSCEELCNRDAGLLQCVGYMYEHKNRGKCTVFQYSIDDKIIESPNSTAVVYRKC